MAIVRVRQHVNPLSQKYQQPTEPPAWSAVYANPEQPLHLDIGCGRGVFLLEIAQQQPHWNFLGLEIREPLVQQANDWRQAAGLQNLSYLFCNVNTTLVPLLRSLPAQTLQRVSIQFPDPWFKKRHQKRRVVQPQLVAALAEFLQPEAMVFVQSDVEAVAQEMCDRFATHLAFERAGDGDWLDYNPLGVATERERSTLLRGEPVYRAIFYRRG